MRWALSRSARRWPMPRVLLLVEAMVVLSAWSLHVAAFHVPSPSLVAKARCHQHSGLIRTAMMATERTHHDSTSPWPQVAPEQQHRGRAVLVAQAVGKNAWKIAAGAVVMLRPKPALAAGSASVAFKQTASLVIVSVVVFKGAQRLREFIKRKSMGTQEEQFRRIMANVGSANPTTSATPATSASSSLSSTPSPTKLNPTSTLASAQISSSNDAGLLDADSAAFTKTAPASTTAKASSAPASAAKAPKKKKKIKKPKLDMFNKRKSDRKSDLVDVLGEATPQQELLVQLSSILASRTPEGFFEELRKAAPVIPEPEPAPEPEPEPAPAPAPAPAPVAEGANATSASEEIPPSPSPTPAAGQKEEEEEEEQQKPLPELAILSATRDRLGLNGVQTAECVASVVNAMLVTLIDDAATHSKESTEKVAKRLDDILGFMVFASDLFDGLAPGVEITPVVYNGRTSKGKLESLFSKYCASGTGQVEMLQQVMGIKDGVAERIQSKAMMESVMSMMKEMGGEDGEGGMEGLAEMMGAMGGAGGLPGMGGGGGGGGLGGMGMPDLGALGDLGAGGFPGGGPEPSPQEIQEMIEGLKAAMSSGQLNDEMRRELSSVLTSSGVDINEMLNAMAMDPSPQSQELVSLFRDLLGPGGGSSPIPPRSGAQNDGVDDLLSGL